MKYKRELKEIEFIPWQPSTWPKEPIEFDNNFSKVIEEIFRTTIIEEINNVISDAQEVNKSIEHRGHIIAIAQFCAIDTLSSYAFFNESSDKCMSCNRTDSKINKFIKYIEAFFPDEYKIHSKELYKLYRNYMIHSWNLFEAGILPGNEELVSNDGILCFGLLNFQNAIELSLCNYLKQLREDKTIQINTVGRYKSLKNMAKSV